MRPTLGRVVLYTIGITKGDRTVELEEFAGTITRVRWGGAPADLPDGRQPAAEMENDYKVWLAVDLHQERWFSPGPVAFDMDRGVNTWRWPPRV